MAAIANRAQYIPPSISSLPTFLGTGGEHAPTSIPSVLDWVCAGKNEAKGVSAPNCTVGLGGRVPLPTVKSSKTYHADVTCMTLLAIACHPCNMDRLCRSLLHVIGLPSLAPAVHQLS